MITTLLDYTLRASAVLALAFVSVGVLRSHSAAVRHLVLASGMFCAAILPMLTNVLPRWEWAAAAEFSELLPVEPRVFVPPPERDMASTEFAPASPPPVQIEAVPASPSSVVAPHVLVGSIYFLGASLSIAVLFMSLIHLRRIRGLASEVREAKWTSAVREIMEERGIRRSVRLLESSSASVLATWGLLRPIIILPAGSSQWSEERIRVVLTHELAHVRRKDWLIQLGVEVFRAALWFNPIAWVACRRLRQESEIACDDAVINRGISASVYAAHLLDLARTLGKPEPALAPALFMTRSSTFEKRFQSMLNPRTRRSPVTRPAMLFIFAASLCLALPLAIVRAAPGELREALQETATRTVLPTASATAAVVQVPQAMVPIPNSIEGVVVRLGSNDPISDADVELRRVEGTPSHPLGPLVVPPGTYSPGAVVRATYPNPADIANVRTKSDGKFTFTNLKPGTYRLRAARAGGAYFPAEYGQRSPKGKGYDFPFVEGQSMRDVRLEMAPTGSISGRILDADGQPAARVRVMALTATHTPGERRLGIIQAVQTDDRGDYRLFWLPPGQYVVAARQEDPRRQTLQLFITPPGSNDGFETYSQAPLTLRALEDGTVVEETFDLVYYGGDSGANTGRTLDLSPGGSLSGIDINIAAGRVRTRHVRGIVIDSAGAAVPGVTVSALPRNSGPSMIAPAAVTDPAGVFDLSGVGPGAYTLRATAAGLAGSAALGPGGSDVEGLAITMSRGFQLPGRITIDGRPAGSNAPELGAINIRLQNTITGLPGASSSVITGETFTVNVPQAGEYRVFVNPILVPYSSDPARRPAIPAYLQNAYVNVIRFNAEDGLSGPLRLAPQAGQFEIVVALNGGTLEGVVTDRQQPAVNAIVVLVPLDRARFDLYRVSRSGGDARFRMQGIPPGEYKVFAWDHVEDGAWFDAAFMRARENGGKSLRIPEGGTAQLSITMERS